MHILVLMLFSLTNLGLLKKSLRTENFREGESDHRFYENNMTNWNQLQLSAI